MKRRFLKWGLPTALTGALLLPCGVWAAEAENSPEQFRAVGEAMMEAYGAEDADEICFQGKTAAVTKAEYNYSLFHKKQGGEKEKNASSKARESCQRYAALYAEAAERGLTYDEKEVQEYVDTEVKPSRETEESFQWLVEGVGSAEEYWEIEYRLYEKQLAIEKLKEALEEEYQNSDEIDRLETSFEEYYGEYGDKLVEEQDFQEIN